MRGKNILLVPLILVLGLTLLGPVNAPVTNTKLRVEPKIINGLPGDSILVYINVEEVTDLYAFGFSLQYKPYATTLALVNVMDGGFLAPDAFLTYVKDPFHGTVQVGATLIGGLPGVSGSGTIAILEFVVIEAGDSSLDLFDTVLLDHTLAQIPHNTINGYYLGPMADLVSKQVLPGRTVWVGETGQFLSTAKNLGNTPLYVRTRWTMTGEDGRVFTFYDGQRTFPILPRPTEYLYVDGYQLYLDGWTKVGASPWLNAPGDGNYIEATDNAMDQGKFTFQDLSAPLGPLDFVKSVSLQFYTFGPYDETNDFDVIAREPIGEAPPSTWCGSAYSSGSPGWTGLRWVDTQDITTLFPALKTTAGINNFKIRYIDFYTADGLPRPAAGIDAARMVVEFASGMMTVDDVAPIQVIQPGQMLAMPMYQWETSEGAVNKWFSTATLEYKYYPLVPGQPQFWLEGEKVSTFTWFCKQH